MKRHTTATGPNREAASDTTPPCYPTVREHLLSRREALGVLGVSFVAGAGVMSKGCLAGMQDAPGAASDASTTYLTFRVPVQGDLAVDLADAAPCRFSVNALTYYQDTYDYLTSHEAEAEQACVDAVGPYTYDTLGTVAGVLQAEDDIRDGLSAVFPGVELATLSILDLLPPR